MKDENESASNASFFVDEPVAAPEKKKEERKVTVPTVSNQGVAPNTDLLTEAKNAVAAPIAPVQVAQQAASANAAMPNPVTSSMKNVTGGINDFLSTTTLKDVAPYLLGAGGYALGKHLLNLRGEAGQAVTPPQTTPTQPAPTQAATAQPAAPQTPVNQQPPTTQPPVANTQQAPQSIVFDQPPEIPSDERLVEKHMEAVKEELGKKEVPAGNPKVTAGEVGSLVESEKNAAANQQATLHKQTQSNRQPFEGVNVVKTGTGKDAYVGQSDASKFKKSYGHASEIPKDWAFVPGAQYSDLMRNNIGPETYLTEYSKREFPDTYKKAQADVQEINRGLNRPTNEELKASGVKPPKGTPSIFKEIDKNKLVKVGGVAGALVALSDIANANTLPEKILRSADLATDYIPGVGQFKQGMTPTEAGAPVVPPEYFANAAKLGSPYYGTEWAKKEREKARK